MSLTSYRAAPPRGRVLIGEESVLFRASCRFGGDLLSHVLGRSTIGAAALNGRVRDGIGCFARAHATKPAGRTGGMFPPCATRRVSFPGGAVSGGAPASFSTTLRVGRLPVVLKADGFPVFFRIGSKPLGRLVPVN